MENLKKALENRDKKVTKTEFIIEWIEFSEVSGESIELFKNYGSNDSDSLWFFNVIRDEHEYSASRVLKTTYDNGATQYLILDIARINTSSTIGRSLLPKDK